MNYRNGRTGAHFMSSTFFFFTLCGLFESHFVIVVAINDVLYFEPPFRRGATVLGDRVNVSGQCMSSD